MKSRDKVDKKDVCTSHTMAYCHCMTKSSLIGAFPHTLKNTLFHTSGKKSPFLGRFRDICNIVMPLFNKLYNKYHTFSTPNTLTLYTNAGIVV